MPHEAIAALDNALAEVGEDVVLRRVVGAAPNQQNIDVTCRAMVRSWRLKEEDLASGIKQALIIVIMSPTQIADAQWPGGEVATALNPNPAFPRLGDALIIRGHKRTITGVDAIPVGDEVVRFDLQVLG
jgi:hypothetical protein